MRDASRRHSALCTLHSQLIWPARVTLPVQRLKRPLHHFNACRPKWCSRQESHLHWRRSRRRVSAVGLREQKKWSLQPGMLRRGFFTKEIRRLLHGGEWSQSPVLPWAWLAYDACLSAGSTAMLANGLVVLTPTKGLLDRRLGCW